MFDIWAGTFEAVLLQRFFTFRIRDDESNFKCHRCNLDFPSDNFLQRHLRIEHFPCKACGKLFSVDGLKRHVERERLCRIIISSVDGRTNQTSEVCELCDRKILDSGGSKFRIQHYQYHLRQVDESTCILCARKYPGDDLMCKHFEKTSCSRTKYVQCYMCSTKFALSFNRRWESSAVRRCLDHFIECWKKQIEEHESNSDAELDINLGESSMWECARDRGNHSCSKM